jgi:hypothetical protein
MYLKHNIVGNSRNHCCSGNTTTSSVCVCVCVCVCVVFELHVTVDFAKEFSFVHGLF